MDQHERAAKWQYLLAAPVAITGALLGRELTHKYPSRVPRILAPVLGAALLGSLGALGTKLIRNIVSGNIQSAPSYRGSASSMPMLDNLYENHGNSFNSGGADIRGMRYDFEKPYTTREELMSKIRKGKFNIRDYPVDIDTETHYYNRDI